MRFPRAVALALMLAALPAAGQDEAVPEPPRPPECTEAEPEPTPPDTPEPPRPPERMDMDPPIGVVRPPRREEIAPTDPEEASPSLDARTETTPPGPPRRPVGDEPEAVLPDEERAPLEVTAEDRAAYEACLADLEALEVAFSDADAIDGEGRCGAALPVRVTAIGDVALEPAIRVQCPVARALARWTREALVPAAAEELDAEVETIYTAGAYACRGRNLQEDARLSEHAFANAVDVTGFAFASREAVAISPRDGRETAEARFQREIRRQACAQFRTVLGPGSDDYHDDHLHFDQRERTNDYRLCE